MGNIGSQTHVKDNRLEILPPVKTYPKAAPHVKVLPELQTRLALRHTDNGDILQSGGTLSGRHQAPLRHGPPTSYLPSQRYSFQKPDHFISSQSKTQIKSYKSEPDLRLPNSSSEVKENRYKKKYKAPPPPNRPSESNCHSWNDEECHTRKPRLFKTRVETKKESSHFNVDQSKESSSDIVEDTILAKQNLHYARPNSMYLVKDSPKEEDEEDSKRLIRGEPSGKESSTQENSPEPENSQKPRTFYFGMDKEDSDLSSNYLKDDLEIDDEHSAIALKLRPVLPRKPPEIPHFSPSTAWRLLDARSQDSGISGDARPPLSTSWTPQQDLGDDSSLEEVRRDLPKSLPRHRPHIFSLSLPRDLQPAVYTAAGHSKPRGNRLKRSVSGVLNTLSLRRDHVEEVDVNWLLSSSAPNSINDNPHEDVPFAHANRLMYLPEKVVEDEEKRRKLSAFSKSCEELKMPESLRDEVGTWSREPSKKQKKFTFQSTVRQIERRKMAEKLSREAEKKEKQRLREVEAMRRVEEEFQKKRTKEKARIRHQLRMYAMDEVQWSSLPFKLNEVGKLEERQEPEGAALSSSTSSPVSTSKYGGARTQATQELSEFRQVQRDYKEYRSPSKYGGDVKLTTVHPEVTCNMPTAKGNRYDKGNYRKEFAFGMKSSLSVDSSNNSEYSSKMYKNKCSPPITRF